MNDYVPMLYLFVTLIGGCVALANLAPVPARPQPLQLDHTLGAGRPFGRYRPVTTPPGPILYRTTISDYTPPQPTGPRQPRLFPVGRFTAPNQPRYTHRPGANVA